MTGCLTAASKWLYPYTAERVEVSQAHALVVLVRKVGHGSRDTGRRSHATGGDAERRDGGKPKAAKGATGTWQERGVPHLRCGRSGLSSTGTSRVRSLAMRRIHVSPLIPEPEAEDSRWLNTSVISVSPSLTLVLPGKSTQSQSPCCPVQKISLSERIRPMASLFTSGAARTFRAASSGMSLAKR
jgi:hypothetical protein